MLIDSHVNLHAPQFDEDRDACARISHALRDALGLPNEIIDAGDAGIESDSGLVLAAQGAVFWLTGLYKGLWRFASLPDLWNIARASVLGAEPEDQVIGAGLNSVRSL